MKKRSIKVVALMLIAAMVFALAGCTLGNQAQEATTEPEQTGTEEQTQTEEVTVGLERNKYPIPDYSGVGEGVRVIRLSVSMNEADYGVAATGAMVKTFVDKMEELSGGKVVVQVYPGNQLAGTTDDIINGLNTGAFEMAEVGAGNWGDYTTAFAPLNVPFVLENDEIAYEVATGEIGDIMFDQFTKDTSMHPVGFMYMGMRTITNDKKEIHSPADIKGLKIRTQSDPIQRATFEAIGASTMTVAFSELFTALQQGQCDGQDNPISLIVTRKFYEVQSYITMLNHMPNISIVFASDMLWNQLTDEEKGWMIEAGEAATKAGYDTCVSTTDLLRSQLEAYGLTITDLSAEEHQAFVDCVSGSVWNDCKAKMGDDLWNKLMDAVK